MFRHPRRRPPHTLSLALLLATLAGCQDATTSPIRGAAKPHFAQGDNGVWTVNTLADNDDGTCDDTNCTLREAIAAAAPRAKIVFASSLQGDIKLTEHLTIPRSLTVDGGGRIAVDGQRNDQVLFINLAVSDTVGLARLTVKNGFAAGSYGGGVLMQGGVVTLDSVTVTNNEAGISGGGILTLSSDVTIRNSTIAGNVAQFDGGGILTQNRRLMLANSTVSGNTAGDFGGGININETASATVERSTISGNTASHGAGIRTRGSLAIRSSTITANIATGLGGGIRFIPEAGDPFATVTVFNSIVVGNTGPTAVDCYGAGIASLGYNLTRACSFAAEGDVLVTTDQIFTQVLEATLKDNGGPTKTHALIARGRAVDVGYCPGETIDQRGFARPVNDPIMPNVKDGCDIGAYEAQGAAVAAADLAVSQTVDKTSVKQGDLLTYSVRVRNLGPQSAPNVVLNDVLSSGVSFVDAKVNKGSVSGPPKGETGTLTWSLGTMLDQANEVAEIKVTVLVKGKTSITSKATVKGDVADPNEANNSAAITVSVVAGSAPKKG